MNTLYLSYIALVLHPYHSASMTNSPPSDKFPLSSLLSLKAVQANSLLLIKVKQRKWTPPLFMRAISMSQYPLVDLFFEYEGFDYTIHTYALKVLQGTISAELTN